MGVVFQNRFFTGRETKTSGSSEGSLRKDYENLSVAEAIEYVTSLSDPQILRAALNQEKRKKVIDVINQRLVELG